MTSGVRITETGDMDQLLAQLEIGLRTSTLRKALRAGGTRVARRARQLCPRSSATGSAEYWSQTTAATRAGVKSLADTIGVVVREYGHTWVVVVGPQYPAGALGHLVEYGHAEVLWGQPTGRRVPPHPFLRPAADETVEEVNGAIISTLRGAI